MALVKKITRQGNSASMIFDQPIMKHMGWDIGTEVEIRLQDDSLILSRHRYASDDDVKASSNRKLKRHRKSLERLAK